MYDPETEGIQMVFVMVVSSVLGMIYVLIELLPAGIATVCLAWMIESGSAASFLIGIPLAVGIVLAYDLDYDRKKVVSFMKRLGTAVSVLLLLSALSVAVVAVVTISLISA